MQKEKKHKVKMDVCRCGVSPHLNEHFTRESGAVLYTIHCHKCGRIVADTNIDDVLYDWNHYICHSKTERKLHGCLNMMIESARLMYECGGVEGLEEAAELAYKFYCEMDEALFRRIKENENRKKMNLHWIVKESNCIGVFTWMCSSCGYSYDSLGIAKPEDAGFYFCPWCGTRLIDPDCEEENGN